MQILLCCSKNNFVLIGEFGVGKIVIVEGFVMCIVKGDVFEGLCDKKIVLLEMGSLFVGVKFWGEFEECFKGVIDEVVKLVGEIILFVDEIYIIVGVGKIEGSFDVGNMFKFVLVCGELYLIGVIMFDEYCEIEKDVVFEWCFQLVFVDEFSVEDIIFILCGIKECYQVYYNVEIIDFVLVVVVMLFNCYIIDW